MSKDNNLKGLGGWLILVGIGLIAYALLLPVIIIQVIKILQTEFWQVLTAYQPEIYNSNVYSMLWGVALFDVILFFTNLYVIYLFFKKHYLFPKLFITLQTCTILSLILSTYIFSLMDDQASFYGIDKSVIKRIIYAVIWITYMLKSVRVKNTFVEHRPV